MRFVAGRGAVAKRHQEDAGRGAVAKRHRENAGRSAVAKRLAALWRIAIRKTLPAVRCAVANSHREDANQHREATASGSASGEAPSERRCPQGDVPWRIAIGKLLAGAPWRSAIGKMLAGAPWRSAIGKMLAGAPWQSAIGKMLMTGNCTRKQHREATPPRKAAGKREAAGFDF